MQLRAAPSILDSDYAGFFCIERVEGASVTQRGKLQFEIIFN